VLQIHAHINCTKHTHTHTQTQTHTPQVSLIKDGLATITNGRLLKRSWVHLHKLVRLSKYASLAPPHNAHMDQNESKLN